MVAKYPLKWPDTYPRTTSRKSAKFSSRNSGSTSRSLTIEQAVQRLDEELRRLGVRDLDHDVVISTNHRVGISGLPRSDQSPADPGVCVSWEIDGKPRNMPIDIYDRAADNIAAVAAVLGYLRGVERHGGRVIQDKAMESFDAIAPPDSCWLILGLEAGDVWTKESVLEAFKARAREPLDHRGLPVDMGVLVKARDEALEQLRSK